MSEERKDGGAAFAAVSVGPAGDIYHQHGMSLRDWFAGQALAGFLASVSSNEVMTLCTEAAKARGMEEEPFIAKVAYTFAEAMLLERQKP